MREILSKRISDVMSKKIISLKPDDSIKEVKRLIDKYGFNAFPVVDSNNKLVGIVTKSDYLKAFTMGFSTSISRIYQLWANDVRGIMTGSPYCVTPESTLIDAAKIIADYGYRSVPIVNKEGKLVGMITSTDITKFAMIQLEKREKKAKSIK